MRATDDRYSAERDRFDLAIRMIRLGARTGTIRGCTGFTEDRIRKICTSYFALPGTPLRRRRGKTPSQVGPLLSSARRQSESSLLAGLLFHRAAAQLDGNGEVSRPWRLAPPLMGRRFCDAYEDYQLLLAEPLFDFEWGWNLYRSLTVTGELRPAWCGLCEGLYVQDAFALNYARCPNCELKDRPGGA